MFRKIVGLITLVAFINFLVGCTGARYICIEKNGKQHCSLYSEIGLVDIIFDTGKESPEIEYGLNWTGIVWAAILAPTVIFPIIIVAFFLFAPVGPKNKATASVH